MRLTRLLVVVLSIALERLLEEGLIYLEQSGRTHMDPYSMLEEEIGTNPHPGVPEAG